MADLDQRQLFAWRRKKSSNKKRARSMDLGAFWSAAGFEEQPLGQLIAA
jgi:hypothetical protein